MKTQEEFEKEIRAAYGDNVELRVMEVRAAEGERRIEGYAATFNDVTDLGYFREQIAVGAFDGHLADDVRLLINHTGVPLARTTNGTLRLSVDETGLRYEAQLADTQEGRDLYTLIKRGDISQSSFAFSIEEEAWDNKANLRTVNKVGRLYDVSPVTYPAYATTTVAARNAAAAAQEPTPEPAPEPTPAPEPKKEEVRKLAPEKPPVKMNLNELKALRAKH